MTPWQPRIRNVERNDVDWVEWSVTMEADGTRQMRNPKNTWLDDVNESMNISDLTQKDEQMEMENQESNQLTQIHLCNCLMLKIHFKYNNLTDILKQ